MDGAADRPEGPAQVEVDPDELGSGSGAPQAVTEQPDLSFERYQEARWIGDVMGMRIAALALVRRARRRRGEAVLPLPWAAIVGTAIVAGAVVGAVAWVARAVAG
jgi:hypothetical protein